jgi:hypothetical protein
MPGFIFIVQRVLLFAGTLSTAAWTDLNCPEPSAATVYSHTRASAAIAVRAMIAHTITDLNQVRFTFLLLTEKYR